MNFQFKTKRINNLFNKETKIILVEPILDGSNDWAFLTSDREIIRLNTKSASIKSVLKFNSEQVPETTALSMVLDKNFKYIALTGRSVPGEKGGKYNWGSVFDLNSGEAQLKLECGDYYPHMAPFPVAFSEQEGKPILIHATDWDRLDILDLNSKKSLTERDLEKMPENPEYGKNGDTEWSGTLLISPDQSWIATIGWHWHPVGRAASWSLKDWLTKNIWESDNGSSKHIYTSWPYFWDGPFCWIDNTRLCVWGHEEGPTDDQGFPLPSVAIFNVASGELINWFEGPLIDLLYFDKYLFSGGEQDDELTVWDIESGKCIFKDSVFEQFPRQYHPTTKEFISIKEDGELILTQWSE